MAVPQTLEEALKAGGMLLPPAKEIGPTPKASFPQTLDEALKAGAQVISGPQVSDDRTPAQVSDDQSRKVIEGAANIVTHPLDTLAGVAGTVGGAVNVYAHGPMAVFDFLRKTAKPVTDLARGAGALIAPDSIAAPTREEFEDSAKFAGQNAAMIAAGEGIATAVPLVKSAGLKLLPSTTRAGANLNKVMAAAGDIPLDLTEAQKVAARAKELTERGAGSAPAPLRAFMKNRKPVTGKFAGQKVTMQPDPMTYREGFDFASNAGRVSADEATAMAPTMKAQLKQFAGAMKAANREAAVSVGMGDVFDQAMKEYRQARTIQDAADIIKKWSLRVAAGGTLGYELWKNH